MSKIADIASKALEELNIKFPPQEAIDKFLEETKGMKVVSTDKERDVVGRLYERLKGMNVEKMTYWENTLEFGGVETLAEELEGILKLIEAGEYRSLTQEEQDSL